MYQIHMIPHNQILYACTQAKYFRSCARWQAFWLLPRDAAPLTQKFWAEKQLAAAQSGAAFQSLWPVCRMRA